ncbi:MAG: SDR family NAD(P)-dependent oxidoreductase, partial [Roseobacter sp.]
MTEVKTAVVTGSSSGIGLGIAKGLAAAGMNIVMNGIEAPEDVEHARKQLEDDYGIKAVYSRANMMTPDGPEELIALAQNTFGRVDV